MQKEDKDWHLQFRDERGKPTTEDIRDQIMTRINGDKINEPEAALIRDALHKVIEVGDVSLTQIPRDWNKAVPRRGWASPGTRTRFASA